MIKLIICDLDGTLYEAREVHYLALNKALESIDPKFVISREEHLTPYDGLPTKKKLELLSKSKNLPLDLHKKINALKQKFTIEVLKDTVKEDHRLREVLGKLREEGIIIYVASNSVRESIKVMLLKTGLMEHIDYYLSNEDVKNSKPNSEIYLKAMAHAGVNPHETLIIEDSPHGRESGLNSGAFLYGVDNPEGVTYEGVRALIDKINQAPPKYVWTDTKMNVVIPMVGSHASFRRAGYSVPRYLIQVDGKPLIQRTVESLAIDANYIFIVSAEDQFNFNVSIILNLIKPGCTVIVVDHATEGAASTTLLASGLIDTDDHLVIAFCDQVVDYNSLDFIYKLLNKDADGGILTFTSSLPKWSFARTDGENVLEVAEKDPISDTATAGIYYWKSGKDYVKYANQMIVKNKRVNDLFYVAPVFNEAIAENKKILALPCTSMKSYGSPEDFIK